MRVDTELESKCDGLTSSLSLPILSASAVKSAIGEGPKDCQHLMKIGDDGDYEEETTDHGDDNNANGNDDDDDQAAKVQALIDGM